MVPSKMPLIIAIVPASDTVALNLAGFVCVERTYDLVLGGTTIW